MSISLSGDSLEQLETLASEQSISQIEALRRAIATEGYLKKDMKAGNKILLLTSDKEVREVVFR